MIISSDIPFGSSPAYDLYNPSRIKYLHYTLQHMNQWQLCIHMGY